MQRLILLSHAIIEHLRYLSYIEQAAKNRNTHGLLQILGRLLGRTGVVGNDSIVELLPDLRIHDARGTAAALELTCHAIDLYERRVS